MAHRHVVLTRFKGGVTDATIRDWFESVRALQGCIPGIVDFSWGLNDSPEGLSQELTHAFVMTFKDASARDAYLDHPAHVPVKAAVLPLIEAAVVVDFAAG